MTTVTGSSPVPATKTLIMRTKSIGHNMYEVTYMNSVQSRISFGYLVPKRNLLHLKALGVLNRMKKHYVRTKIVL